MDITVAVKAQFFDLYIIQELPKKDILAIMKLTDRQYVSLVKLAKIMDAETINTDRLERIISRKLHVTQDEVTLDQALTIWKAKSKVPADTKEEKFNLDEMIKDSDPIVNTP